MSKVLLVFLLSFHLLLSRNAQMVGDNNNENSTTMRTATTAQQEEFFPEMPENIQIVYIDPQTLLKFDNKGERVMGVADINCDNGRANLATDFDPHDAKDIEMHTKCYDNKTWTGNNFTDPILTIMNLPRHYVPVHKCMIIRIRYMEHIPMIGPHRPLWARYGEYQYCPPQRWLHNVEHGAIVGLYHPCADPIQVESLKSVIRNCLFRHVITPYINLTEERPIALVGWSASLEMSQFDFNLAKNFIKFYARTGPEKVFRDGQYNQLLTKKAKYVTNVIDSEVCPNL